MPIYEYQCHKCGHELEALQKFSDAPLTDCPECQSSELKKKVSAAGFRLSGSGWYETDFKSGSKKNIAGENDRGSSGADTKGKSENSKSDKKSESTAAASKPASDTKNTAAQTAKD